jgi:cell division protein FtsI/penicillin-binding protein 2
MRHPKHVRSSRQVRRLCALGLVLFGVFVGLGVRLVFLQVFLHDRYRKIADSNTQSLSVRDPRRGDILDRNGNPLATSLPVKRVLANPSFMGPHYVEVARRLAPLLSYKEDDLVKRLRPTVIRTNQSGVLVTNQNVDLRRKLTIEQWQQVTQAMATLRLNVDETRLSPAQRGFYRALRHNSIVPADDQQRFYPNKTLASHVVGFAQDTETNFNGTIVLRDLVGRDGIEAWLDPKLRGVRGWRITETDRKKREILTGREQEVDARPGLNVVLTLDLVAQHIVETELAELMINHSPVSASAMVVRPRTGEILAMATLPNYDPNRPGDFPMDHLRNRIISDTVEPGSTFKIVVVSAALNEHLVALTDTFDCEQGHWVFQNKVLHDHEPYGVLSVESIITRSSNIGAAKIGLRLGQERLYDYIRAFGFGTRSDIALGGELRGTVHPVHEWDGLTISRIPMGQGITVTPLQMIMAMCVIANNGKLMRPMLVSRLQDSTGTVFAQYEPQLIRQVIAPEAARAMVTALKTVVSKEGTAPKAVMDRYTVAGKTGTAQKAGGGHYLPGKYVSSFIGFFPTDDPEICISVVVDEPKYGYYGGQTAAPVFKAIGQQIASYLKIKPDREDAGADPVSLVNAKTGPISPREP